MTGKQPTKALAPAVPKLRVRKARAYWEVVDAAGKRVKLFKEQDDAQAWIDVQELRATLPVAPELDQGQTPRWLKPKPSWTHVSDDEWEWHCWRRRNGDPYAR